jgi:hypothetical protein
LQQLDAEYGSRAMIIFDQFEEASRQRPLRDLTSVD